MIVFRSTPGLRRNFAATILLSAFVMASSIAFGQEPNAANIEQREAQSIKQAVALVSPSVVRIQTVGGLDRIGKVLTGTGATTGVVVSQDGYIISSMFNFASEPTSVLVTLLEGTRFPAKVVANDHARMLTLLKIETSNLIPAVPQKEKVSVGQWAIALGRTYDSPSPNVSVGIVSALNRVWGKAIQTDAKISPANYGGPLVSIDGKAMGLLVPLSQQGNGETAGVEWYDSGIGFAIPMADVYASFERLKTGDDLHPGLLGVEIKRSNPYSGKPTVDRVRFNSPAEKAGLKPGDIIVEIDGNKVTRATDLRYALGSKLAGDSIKLVVVRDEKNIETQATLAAKLDPYQSAFLGILPERQSLSEQESAENGVSIRYVYAGSPAEKAGLKKRDRILRFEMAETADAAALGDLVSRKLPGDSVELTFVRDQDEQTVTVELAEIPNVIPQELLPAAIPVAKGTEEASAEKPDKTADNTEKETGDTEQERSELKTGRFTETLPGQEQSFWAYVPEEYNDDFEYTLLVWLHPGGDTMEAAMYKAWKPICDRRGIIIVAPKAKNVAGWTPNEAEFVKDAVEWCTENYTVSSARIYSHGFADGGAFAYGLSFKYRDVYRGVATVASPLRVRPPENRPESRLQFHLVCGENDPLLKGVQKTVDGLRKLKYPATSNSVPEIAHKYPEGEPLDEIGRWADSLDRI